VIAVFTKYDQFRREIRFKLEDRQANPDDPVILKAEMEKIFKDHFLAHLTGSPPFVHLESKDIY
jgi:hypothetical protein